MNGYQPVNLESLIHLLVKTLHMKKELMDAIPLTINALHKAEIEYHGKFGHTLGRIQHIALVIIIDISTQPIVYKPKLWHIILSVSNVSSAMFDICLINHVNPSFTLLIIMIAQISSDLHIVGVNFNNTPLRMV